MLFWKKKKEEKMSLDELNDIIKNEYKQKPIESLAFNLTEFGKNCLFMLDSINIVKNKKTDKKKIKLSLRELTLSESITIEVPIEDFRVLFKEFHFKPPKKPEEICT